MAEIPIQHKPHKRASVWPWVIGALAVLLVVWGLTMYHRGNTSSAAAYTDSATSAGEVSRPIDTMITAPKLDSTFGRPADTTTRRRP